MTLALLTALGCGPDDAREVAERDEVCGEPGPVRILELGDERGIWSIGARWIGERRLLNVTYTDDDGFLGPAQSEQWSVGPCGESPRLIADDTTPWRVLDVWPDTLLGCRYETGEIVTIDLDGAREPHVVFDVDDCNALDETPWGLVDVEPRDEDVGALVLLRYPEDPWTGVAERTVLIDEIRIRADPPHTFPEQHEVLEVRDDELFAITPADELVHYSLLDGSSTTEATGVREFYLSADLGWVIWQDVAPVDDEVEWPRGAIFLRDRSSSATYRLDDASLAATWASPLQFIEQGFVQLRMGALYEEPQRFYSIPSLASFDIPADRDVDRVLDDGRWVVTDALGRSPLERFDASARTFEPWFDRPGLITEVTGDRFEIIENDDCCNDVSPFIASGPLWSVPNDGVPEMLARRATSSYAFLTDDRLLIAVAVDSDGLGELVVVEPGELTEHFVDEHVIARWPALDPDDTIVYGVADGDRTGVWLARLAPD
ncbi:MAG: hypothetical protein IAG13_16455 [Deltaproteobacteria bacterium]|nr:hypothetical protein [Nannocystaceae bacterium]